MMTLDAEEVIRRFLLHKLPKSFRVIMGFSPTPVAPPSSRSSARLSTLRNPLRAPNQATTVNVTKTSPPRIALRRHPAASRASAFVGASANNYVAPGPPNLQALGGSMAILSARLAYLPKAS